MTDTPAVPIIIKLGGSIISHSNKIIDFDYLREFRDLLRDQVILGRRFVIVMGGGQTARNFMDHAASQGNVTDTTDLHWIGTATNTLNAYMVRAFLGNEIAESTVWKFDDVNRLSQMPFSRPVAVVGGFQPGASGDWVALRVAAALGSKQVIDLKNVAGIFNADPKIDPNAKAYASLTWEAYLDLVGNPEAHIPGGSMPVDPVAAREAAQIGMTYYILKGTDLHNLELAINSQEFIGTIVS